jgi:hypothetical protein
MVRPYFVMKERRVTVDLFLEGGAHAVRSTGINL